MAFRQEMLEETQELEVEVTIHLVDKAYNKERMAPRGLRLMFLASTARGHRGRGGHEVAMFTVFGATGHTGAVVAKTLLNQGKKVRVAVRDPAKVKAFADLGAEVVKVDLLDPKSVEAALAGAEGAYLLVPPDPASNDLVGRGRTIVDAFAHGLQSARVGHAVFLSSVGAQVSSGTGPIVITHIAEKALGALPGTVLTFVRAAYFMENLLGYEHPMRTDGVLPAFGGGETYPFPMVATADIGAVAAMALLAPPAANEVIELEGPEARSLTDAAAVASKALGRSVVAKALPLDAVVSALSAVGYSANTAGLYREMLASFGTGTTKFEGVGRHVRGTVRLEDVLGPALA